MLPGRNFGRNQQRYQQRLQRGGTGERFLANHPRFAAQQQQAQPLPAPAPMPGPQAAPAPSYGQEISNAAGEQIDQVGGAGRMPDLGFQGGGRINTLPAIGGDKINAGAQAEYIARQDVQKSNFPQQGVELGQMPADPGAAGGPIAQKKPFVPQPPPGAGMDRGQVAMNAMRKMQEPRGY